MVHAQGRSLLPQVPGARQYLVLFYLHGPFLSFLVQKHCLLCPRFQEEADEGIRDLIQMTKKKLDLDKDDVVSFEDFNGTVKKDPTMTLEVFGPCIPPEGVTKKDICKNC